MTKDKIDELVVINDAKVYLEDRVDENGVTTGVSTDYKALRHINGLLQTLQSLQGELAVEKKYSALKFNSVQLKEECEKELDEAKRLVEVAKCPCCDGSGTYPDSMGGPLQCQWCDESKALLKKMEGK